MTVFHGPAGSHWQLGPTPSTKGSGAFKINLVNLLCSGPMSEEDVSRKGAKAQRRKEKPLETRQRFASLRVCVKHLLPTPAFVQNMTLFTTRTRRYYESSWCRSQLLRPD